MDIMAERGIAEIMAEGQKLTLEHAELLRKSIVGEEMTSEEVSRKAQLEGYLLGLMGQAQALGVGTAVGTEYNPNAQEDEGYDYGDEDEDEDIFASDENEDEVEQPQRGLFNW